MASKTFPLLAAFGFLAAALVLAPTAAADAPPLCDEPITVGGLVTCASDKAVAAVRSAEATAQCILGVPPSTYPNGLGACLAIAPLFESLP